MLKKNMLFKKQITDLKFKFFKTILEYYINGLETGKIRSQVDEFVHAIGIDPNQITECMEIKESARGAFKKRLFLKRALINQNQKDLLEKYFLGNNNLFQGKCTIDQQVFFVFLMEKAVRDKIKTKNDLAIYETEVVSEDEFYLLLRKKLIEECREVLGTKDYPDLLDEIGDMYTIINELELMEQTKR